MVVNSYHKVEQVLAFFGQAFGDIARVLVVFGSVVVFVNKLEVSSNRRVLIARKLQEVLGVGYEIAYIAVC